MRKFLQSTAVSIALVASSAVGAAAAPVDTLLSLVIDASGSIDNTEFDLQRQGYVDAFSDSTVRDFILDTDGGNRNGAVAVNVVQFATNATESLGFSVLDSVGDLDTFTSALSTLSRAGGIGNRTDIQDGITLATTRITDWLNTAGNSSDSVVIDVSGDGEQNEPGDPATASAAALVAGVDRVNGLAILDGDPGLFGYYNANVAAGTDSFVISAAGFGDFSDAVTRKVEFEVSGGMPVIPLPAPALLLIGGLGALATLRRKKAA